MVIGYAPFESGRQSIHRMDIPQETDSSEPQIDGADDRGRREMARQRATELANPVRKTPARKVLQSMRKHWSGLPVLVDHPELPMDNCHSSTSWRLTPYSFSNRWLVNFRVRLFSVTVRTTRSAAPDGISASISTVTVIFTPTRPTRCAIISSAIRLASRPRRVASRVTAP